jgi:hypothetical protein
MTAPAPAGVTLFGAFDRHNFGDLLFPHVLAAALPVVRFTHAGLARRDLSAFGGHRVQSLATLRPTHLVHAGGELLTCSAYEAAVMLLDQAAAARAIARYDHDPAAAAAWAARRLGCVRRIPYVAGRDGLAVGARLVFNAVGGVAWASLPAAARAEARAALAAADWVSVRDRVTLGALAADGIAAALCPDPAVLLRDTCDATVRQRRQGGEVQALRAAFPQGYLACQLGAEFGDDASLDLLAHGLAGVVAASGLGVVLFRAGAAPWHDDLATCERLLRRLPAGAAALMRSLHLWDVCALIAGSRGSVASSLHARLVAVAYALPRVSLRAPQRGAGADKVDAFAATWELPGLPGSVALAEVETAAATALAVPAALLAEHAAQLVATCRAGLAQWARLLPAAGPGQ